MTKERIFIGVIGQIASGKRVLTDFFIKNYGFQPFSLSSIIHQELKKKHVSRFTRKTLQDLGDELRKKYGDDILARKAIEMVKKNYGRKIIIEGIRNPAEIKYFKTLPHFILIGIKAKRKTRFDRVLQRKKSWDPKTWEEFLAVDKRDWGVGQGKSGQQVGRCMKMADYVLTNNGTVEEFEEKVKRTITNFQLI